MRKVSPYKSMHGRLIHGIHETFIDGSSFHLITGSFDARTMTMMQMGSGYEVMLDDKIEFHTELRDSGSTRPYPARLVH
jgi:hypothetical protein